MSMIKINIPLEINLPEDSEQHKFQSLSIFKEIFESDRYNINKIKSIIGNNKCIIWDVGSHIGLFSLLCKTRLSECEIHTFEIIPIRAKSQKQLLHNFNGIKTNLCQILGFMPDVEKCKKYISRQDDYSIELYLRGIKDVPVISVTDYLKDNKVPEILKIDMEGGEVGIIEEFRELNLLKDIKVITGEWHFDKAYNYIKNDLSQHFDIDIKRINTNNNWNHFFAINKNNF